MAFSNPVTVATATASSTSPKVLTYNGLVGKTYVLCLGRYNAADSFSAVTDDGGNTWTRVDYAPKSGTTGRRIEIWKCKPTAPFTSVSATMAGGTSFGTAALVELTGGSGVVNASNAIERAASLTPAAVTLTPTKPRTMVISIIQANSNLTSAIHESTGWTALSSAAEGPKVVYKYNPPAGTALGVSWTLDTSTGSGHAIAAFEEESVWFLWDGTTEIPLNLDGTWNGTSIDPCMFDVVYDGGGDPPPVVNTTLGWSPPNSTTTDINNMLSMYPNPKLMRLYTAAGGGLAPWSSGILTQVPSTSRLWYSFKDWNSSTSPSALYNWLTNRPSSRSGQIDLVTINHEPEQQTGGDPLPADFRRIWQEVIAAIANHPRRNEIMLVPVFTEYYAKRNASWWNDFGIVCTYAGIDAVGFDYYDTGYSSYRTAVERNEFPLSIGRRSDVQKPIAFAEWGIARKPGIDSTGSVAAQAMRDNMAYLRQQDDVPVVSWFYRGECVLDQPVTSDGVTFTRTTEQQAFRDLMALNP